MKDSGAQQNGAQTRVINPGHSKDKKPQELKKATEIFLNKIMAQQAKEGA